MSLIEKPIPGTTCFKEHKQHKVSCQRSNCQHWIPCSKSQNCCIIAANEGPQTLENIGAIFNLTRMRICQIEKKVKEKLKINLS